MRRRPLVALVVVVVVAAIGAGVTIYVVGRGGPSDAAATVTSRIVTAEMGTIRQSISTTGTIAPATQADLTFPAAGKVTGVLVSEGDPVTTGQQLATIDSASLAASLAQARLTLANGQAKLASDQAAGASSEQVTADQASVTTATDGVTAAETALAGATMTSPVNGVVVSVSLMVGQQVSGSSGGSGSGTSGGGSGASAGGTGSSGGASTGSGDTSTSSISSSSGQITVISTDSWIVNASVDSNGVGLIAKGNQATIVPGSGTSTDGAAGAGGAAGGTGGTSIYGTVSSVGLVASGSGQTATFPVVIKVTGSPGGLHAGDTATVTLIYKQLSDVLVVPTAAIGQEDGKSVVRVTSGTTTTRDVTTGLASGGSTQIISGLSEGDQVLVEAQGGPAGPGGSGGGTGTRTGGASEGGGFRGGGGFQGGGGSQGGGGFGGGGFPGGGGN